MKNLRRIVAGAWLLAGAVVLAVLAVLSAVGLAAGPALAHGQAPEANLKALHAGKAGIYVRLGKKDERERKLVEQNPLVDAVIVSATWQQLEPQKGQYSWDGLQREVEQWGKAGKGVVILVGLYGQDASGKQTPHWLWNEPGVRGIEFAGGGGAKGAKIKVPAVWDERFADQFLEPLIAALAKQFNGNPHVWYVMPGFGHIGNLNAQPSREGGPAFLEAGFTGEKWLAYCRRVAALYQKHFTKTPLLLKSAGQFLKDKKHDNYRKEVGDLLLVLGQQGIAIIQFGLDANAESQAMKIVYERSAVLSPLAQKGITRIGLGDDWPLWVPESRRGKGPTAGQDEKYLRQALDNAFGGQGAVQAIPTTLLFCQAPEILASAPQSKDYNQDVAAALKSARDRLKKNEQAIFGK